MHAIGDQAGSWQKESWPIRISKHSRQTTAGNVAVTTRHVSVAINWYNSVDRSMIPGPGGVSVRVCVFGSQCSFTLLPRLFCSTCTGFTLTHCTNRLVDAKIEELMHQGHIENGHKGLPFDRRLAAVAAGQLGRALPVVHIPQHTHARKQSPSRSISFLVSSCLSTRQLRHALRECLLSGSCRCVSS